MFHDPKIRFEIKTELLLFVVPNLCKLKIQTSFCSGMVLGLLHILRREP